MKLLVITGALGNIGWKFLQHICRRCSGEQFERVIGIDQRVATKDELTQLEVWLSGNGSATKPKVSVVQANLSDPTDTRWVLPVQKCEGLLHLAAVNPFPGATWGDATVTLDMLQSVFLEAAKAQRVVFASTNHVMGGYLPLELAEHKLTSDLEVKVGTVWSTGATSMDSTIYAAGKWAGERLNRSLAVHSGGSRTAVSIRLGWIQMGDNLPSTLSATGTPYETPDPSRPPNQRDAHWFRSLWLSNHDLVMILHHALLASADSWPEPHLIAHAVSNNPGTPWDFSDIVQHLGYTPVDNVDAAGPDAASI